MVLGRTGERNDVGIDDPAVSGAHVRLSVDEGALVVTDLDSTNGTAVGKPGLFGSSRPLEPGVPVALQPGDVLLIGDSKMTVSLAADEAVAAPANADAAGAGAGALAADAKGTLEAAGQALGALAAAAGTVVEGGRAALAKVDEASQAVQEGLKPLNDAADSAAASWDALRAAEREPDADPALQAQRQHWTAGLLGGSSAAEEDEAAAATEAEAEAPEPPQAVEVPAAVLVPGPDPADARGKPDPLAGVVVPAPPEEGTGQGIVPQQQQRMVGAEGGLVVGEPADLAASAAEIVERGEDGGGHEFASTVRGALSGGAGGIVNSSLMVNYKPTFLQGASADETKDAKSALLTAILGLERGLAASDAARQKVQKLACALEAINPTRNPLRSPLVNGEWELQVSAHTQGRRKGRTRD